METRWGKRLGRYEIVAELGRGTMGVVYKARDPKIDRFVAVKTISIFGQNPVEERLYRERFFYEAQAAGRLLHPGIVTIFDVSEEPESREPYIVMEFVSGQPLNQLSVENKQLPLDSALRLTGELAEALDYAHAQGVVHRDIKPANILITEDGHAKIADFGIAKMNLAHLTIAGHVVGTPAYMSPEQLEGGEVDGRSDLFSLGAVLYSMITGYSPFQGNSATTVCFKVANRDPLPATAFDPGLPLELDAVISRAMAKDPAQRYQRGMQFALDLRELRERILPQSKTDTSTAAGAGRAGVVITSNNTAQGGRGNSVSGTKRLRHRILENRYLVPATLVLAFCFVAVLFKMTHSPAHRVTTPLNPIADTGSGALVNSGENLPTRAAIAAEPGASPPPATGMGTADQSENADVTKPSSVQGHKAKRVPHAAGFATLQIQVQHHFREATLSLWIDSRLAYSHSLHGENKKHLLVLRGVEGYETAKLQVPVGEHNLRVRGQSDENSIDESKTITTNFAKGDEKILRIDFAKHNREMRVALH
jgi:serine/threonine-protein kinase